MARELFLPTVLHFTLKASVCQARVGRKMPRTGDSLAERVRSGWEHYGLPRYFTNNEMYRGLERRSLRAEAP